MSTKTRKRKLSSLTTCPCCSGKKFQNCCSLILQDHSAADTPEKLMRSRYTAFVIEDTGHLLRSWDKSFSPSSLEFEKSIRWLKLTIIEAESPLEDESVGKVTFTASFIEENNLVQMKEKSTFIRKKGLWYYQEGVPQINKSQLALNQHCPCGSGKKFKRCCKF